MEDRIYLSGMDGNIYKIDLWEIPSTDFDILQRDNKKASQLFVGHSQNVNCISLSLDGSVLVSGSNDGTLKFWETSSCQLLRTIDAQLGPISYVKVILRTEGPPTEKKIRDLKDEDNLAAESPGTSVWLPDMNPDVVQEFWDKNFQTDK
eukprot:TRINITY_DN807_c0_g6_i1.p1 TRINITY_DN807_c0_g6~~TRINITY_DN807_c0_g6_i1.p1  ORF type:complete len:149 (-),score=25.60 TRINITY_DN807_c0_g6_i1:1-447(-)